MTKTSTLTLAFLSFLLFILSTGNATAQWFNSSGSAFIKLIAHTLAVKNSGQKCIIIFRR
ncbi:MAG TPA: hypothetical protein EYH12_02915 [Psychromonas hadalis]|nr:hypothetical protein [Psychromonas hadalis]